VTSENVNIVAFLGVKIKKLYDSCYAKKERGFIDRLVYFPGSIPLNSKLFRFRTLASSTIFILFVVSFSVENNITELQSTPRILITFMIIVFSLFLVHVNVLLYRAWHLEKKNE
jgi:hypothetical protein